MKYSDDGVVDIRIVLIDAPTEYRPIGMAELSALDSQISPENSTSWWRQKELKAVLVTFVLVLFTEI